MKLKRAFCGGFLLSVVLISPAWAKEWLLEKLGKNEVAIARSYLDDFDRLIPKERVLLYYLFRAAVAGRDIYYDQRHRDALAIRSFVEDALPKNKKLLDYAKLLWVHNSQYHARTGMKFVPAFNFDTPAALKKSIFDKNFEPVLTNLTPKPEEGDILSSSAMNIYDPGISFTAFENLPAFWKTKLNVRFALDGDKIVPQTYKIGGVYGLELSNAAYFLRKALPLTTGLQKTSLENLIRYYKTGDEALFRKASIDWLRSETAVDTINGFVESYMDPRQVVGSWEGLVYYTAKDPVLEKISENVQYFEDGMPWDDRFKKKKIKTKPVATLINVAAAIGEAGPVTWSGINLPNYQDIRTKYGSKNVILVNLMEARDQIGKEKTIDEFYLPEYRPLMKRYYDVTRKMSLYMHEVIGHGSGKADPKLTEDPRNYIGKNYGAWEEARATLVAWHHIADPKLVEMGVFAEEEQSKVMKALYLLELQGQLVRLRSSKGEEVLREAHDRSDQMIFEYLRQNTDGFEVVQKGEKYYVLIKDVQALYQGAGRLLKIVHEAKATGDKKTVDDYLEKYGNRFNKKWRDDVIRRANTIGLAETIAMVFPKLIPVMEKGEVVDVELDNTENFAEQQLRFGKISKMRDIDEGLYH